MSDLSLFKYYKKIVEEGHETPPESAWDEISKELDVDEVWDNVSVELDIHEVWNNVSVALENDRKRKIVRLAIAWSIAASILVMVGIYLMSGNFINSETQNMAKTEIFSKDTTDSSADKIQIIGNDPSNIKPVTKPTTIAGKRRSVVYQNLAIEHTQRIDDAEKQITQDSIQEVFITDESINRKESATSNIAEYSLIQSLDPSSIGITLSLEDINTHLITSNDRFNNSLSFTVKNKLSVGISTIYKNTWLLNKETFNALNPSELNSTNLQFYPDLGLNIQYQISDRWAFESKGFISSKYGQDYKAYIYGDYSKKSISLKYTSVELLIKYKSNKSKLFNNLYFNTIAGIYLSKLRTAKLDINNDQSTISDQYHNFDYGLTIGQDFEVYLFNNISLAPGFYFKVGIPNIYNDKTEIPSSLRVTRNGSIEFRLSIYYKLFK